MATFNFTHNSVKLIKSTVFDIDINLYIFHQKSIYDLFDMLELYFILLFLVIDNKLEV